jgi:ketosteroid isomerase-like protein
MLSGSVVEKEGVLQIETHVVDVTTGVMEASYTTSGKASDFVDLENKVALEIIARLDLPATDEEREQLMAQRNTNAEALRMLLEAEGGAKPVEPQSSAPAPVSFATLLSPAAAFADDTETAIRAVLERYRVVTEARQVDALPALFVDFSDQQRAAQTRYFEGVRDLKVEIGNVDIVVVGDEAVVSYTRTDDFTDAKTGRPMHVSVRLTKTLRLENGNWKLAGAK